MTAIHSIRTSNFLNLYKPVAKVLYGYALKLTKNDVEAQDLVQETIYRAYKNLNTFDEGSNFKAWMSTIMRNMFINNYRKYKKRKAAGVLEYYATSRGQFVSNDGYNNLRCEELTKALDKLDELYRQPLIMVGEGYHYDEIAKYLNIPIGTLKSRIHHGRKKLRKMLKGWYN